MAIEVKPLMMEISEVAIEQIKATIASQTVENLFLRVYVQGGCGGISYGMALDNRGVEGDTEIEVNGIKVVVDKNSLPYVNGATVDFEDKEGKAGFKISNPNVDLSALGGGCSSGSCGSGSCGSGGCC